MTTLVLAFLAAGIAFAALIHVCAFYAKQPALHVPVEFEPVRDLSQWRQPADQRHLVVYEQEPRP